MKPIRKDVTMLLPCKLTAEQFEERAKGLAYTEQELATEESEQESIKQGLKKKLNDIITRRTVLAGIVSRSEEQRDISCVDDFDFTVAQVRRTRLDTGEIVVTRPMTDEERQLGLWPPRAC
jgi:hypothetical protein